MKQLFLPLCAFTLLVASCTKEDITINHAASPDAGIPKQGETIIPELTGSYKLVKALLTEDKEPRDVTNEVFPSCEQDNLRILKSDFTYEVLDEGEVCASERLGTWEMVSLTDVKIGDAQYSIARFDGKLLELTVDKGPDGIYTEIWDKQ